MVTTQVRPGLKVRHSEFVATCDCEDFWRKKDYEQTESDFQSRKTRASGVQAVAFQVKHGAVGVETQTADKHGPRKHEVMLSRGDGDPAVCKHIVSVLTSKAIMPDRLRKDAVFTEEQAQALAQQHQDAVVASVNNVYVVGWDKEEAR